MKMIRNTAAAFALLALATAASAQQLPAQPAAPPALSASPPAAMMTLQGADRDAALAQANQALNGITRLQGRFQQTSADGSRSGGAFYLQRPGKLRFEYDPPATMLIVSDGSVVAMRDRALRTTDRTLLRATPLNLVLRSQVDLARDARITRVARAGDWVLITARDRSGQTEGEITLQFQAAQLRSWDITDAAGARTRIALSSLTQPASFDRRIFRLEDIVENRPGPH